MASSHVQSKDFSMPRAIWFQPYVRIERLTFQNGETDAIKEETITMFSNEDAYNRIEEITQNSESSKEDSAANENSAPHPLGQENQQHEAVEHGVAFHSQDGNTVIWLQPSVQIEPNTVHSMQNGEITVEETSNATAFISTEEIVHKQVEEEKKSESDTEDSMEEYKPKVRRHIIKPKKISFKNTPNANLSPKSDAAVPVKVLGSMGSTGIATKEDGFDHFGKYIASILRDLPSKASSCKLQKEFVILAMQEQMKLANS